ncbi:MAG TPA: helicase [Sulfurovum sp.]|nr:helicase [Sulfurovum sp.]
MILDNKQNGLVGDTLKKYLTKDASLSLVTNNFSIFSYRHLQKELRDIKDVRLLFGSPYFKTENPTTLLGDTNEISERNRMQQMYISKKCAEWIESKVDVEEAKISGAIPTKLTHIKSSTDVAISGSSDFTCSGLGYCPSNSYDMNTLITSNESTEQLLGWFNSLWNHDAMTHNVKVEMLAELKKLHQDNAPEFIYFVTLYNLFKDLLSDIDEEKIIKTKTGFKDTLVWNKLYNFQKDGVLGAIDKLEKYNGCIIADSVGLGKTFEALGVIKYYELRNDRVLVLAPKKLRENWTVYTVNDKRNILSNDRFNYDVLNHTDLSRESGKSGEINLETINWGNYDLIVIDESHNFRNNNPSKIRKTRYMKLMEDILQAGVKTKVLMLSATPVNNKMTDLKNQVSFITEGNDTAFEEHGIKSIEITLKKAQQKFNTWLDLNEEQKSVDKLLDMMNMDYFKLLDLVTIARSRQHIEKYYNIEEIGKFPQRKTPVNIKADIDLEDQFPPLLEINRSIRKLNLSAYSPLKYVKADRQDEYNKKYDISLKGGSTFRQTDREQSLIHLMRVNLFKRMESSINSFSLTLRKLLAKIDMILDLIANHNSEYVSDLSILDVDIESDEFSTSLVGGKVKVLLQDVDVIRWQQDLEEDRDRLLGLVEASEVVDASRDAKLKRLKYEVAQKIENPVNNGNKKVVIFTAFTDTAEYLYRNIAQWMEDEYGLYAALVSGSGKNATTMAGVKVGDMNNILINFSPLSKERAKIDSDETREIDILIATDCISEGQNLQDCDYLINYDIHWNPVRIIQRFGRIDRLGSVNDSVQLVNFWPNMELDEYINLEARVSGRMVLLDVSATGEENIIDYDEKKKMNDLEYRRKQLKQLQEAVVDVEELSGGISITDLTLNDFKMDLMEYMKEHQGELESAPLGICAVAPREDDYMREQIDAGVIFCLKLLNDKIHTANYALDPYYLVYVSREGEIMYGHTRAKKILDLYKKLCKGQHSAIDEAVSLFHKETKRGKEMQAYRSLFKEAVDSIIGKKEETGVASLFERGGTTLTADTFKGMEDFEIISYLVVE